MPWAHCAAFLPYVEASVGRRGPITTCDASPVHEAVVGRRGPITTCDASTVHGVKKSQTYLCN